jgi:hypothetical protein
LHQFIVSHGRSSTYYSTSIHETTRHIAETDSRDGKKNCIGELLSKVGDKVNFEYDFSDSWMHTVKLIASAEYSRQKKEVKLLAGERACPPEDCGGVPAIGSSARPWTDHIPPPLRDSCNGWTAASTQSTSP